MFNVSERKGLDPGGRRDLAALAELVEDLVVADRLADHVAEIVPLGVPNDSESGIESPNAVIRLEGRM